MDLEEYAFLHCDATSIKTIDLVLHKNYTFSPNRGDACPSGWSNFLKKIFFFVFFLGKSFSFTDFIVGKPFLRYN